ncbi:MAG: type II secretion system GspH family protein [Phycisphaerae bacterium]|nr:prepilin-type N-terminal cleavage/methylation domain-containing protein [Phycisphaerae bacterium]MCZ2399838.1 type II secretion system GspH family protein [Phycisphaerae bacterium]
MKRTRLAGFTLVELLTVIAVISLLIAIVIPAISAARNTARDTATAKQISSIDAACEIFRNDNGNYPISGGRNPFEGGQTGSPVTQGAQWLAIQLLGADQAGFVKPTLENDSNGDGRINYVDWLAWYDVSNPFSSKVSRLTPYVSPDPKTVTSAEKLAESTGTQAPMLLLQGSSIFRNAYLPMFIDAHGGPLLYYVALTDLKPPRPLTTGNPTAKMYLGTYDHSHNAGLTGSSGPHGEFFGLPQRGWDFAAASTAPTGQPAHPLGRLGFANPGQVLDEWPTEEPSFASVVLNRQIFESTRQGDKGRLVPFNPDRFLLISAGKDGLYGTSDDIRNFNKN